MTCLFCCRYLYLDEVHLSDATCVGILYAAKKYMVTSLQEKCKEYLKQNLRQETVCTALEHAVQMNEEDLEETALEYIDEPTEECLQSALFRQISHGTLCRILQRDSLNAEEIDVFRACLECSGARCLEEGVPVTVDKIRNDLGKALYLIRFPVMDISDFSNEVVNKGLLSDKEVIAVFLALTREKPPPNLQFSNVERSGQLSKVTSVFTTGMNKTALTSGGPHTTLGNIGIYPPSGIDVTLKCIYFANTNREAFKKVKRVDIQCTDTGITYSSYTIRPRVGQGKPDNGYFNAKAIFKEEVVLKYGYWNNISFHIDPPLSYLEAMYFQGTPAMAGDAVQFSLSCGNFYQFTGIGFTKN